MRQIIVCEWVSNFTHRQLRAILKFFKLCYILKIAPLRSKKKGTHMDIEVLRYVNADLFYVHALTSGASCFPQMGIWPATQVCVLGIKLATFWFVGQHSIH